MRRLSRTMLLALSIGPALGLAACNERASTVETPASTIVGGDANRGARTIRAVGCGGCHIIPGIAGADGLAGPPLNLMGRRVFLAGLLRNTPDNMMTWLREPQRVLPGNAMPDTGLTEEQARNITAYLYTLR